MKTVDNHPFTEMARAARQIVTFVEESDMKLFVASGALATVFSLLIELAPDDECRCYFLSHLLNAIYEAKNRFKIADADIAKQILEIQEEMSGYVNMLLERTTEGQQPN